MKKASIILLAVTAAFFCMLLGFFIGRNVNDEYIQLSNTTDSTPSVTNNYVTTDKVTNTQPNTATTVNTAPPQEKGKYNLNNATIEELQDLPGIGEVIAKRIVQYREVNGGFASIEDICQVDGIGEKRFEQIKDFITVGG